MQLFSLQKATATNSYNAGIYVTNYSLVPDTEIIFEDNPGEVDLWNVPRKNEEITTSFNCCYFFFTFYLGFF